MKIRFLIAIVLGVAATFSTIVVAQSISQTGIQPRRATGAYRVAPQVQGQALALPANSQNAQSSNLTLQAPSVFYPEYQQSNFFQSARDSVQPKVDKKLREYKKAKSSSDKSKLKDELKELLEAQFEERLKGPVGAIVNSRKRLDQLTEQHTSREKNSREIVSLRLKVIVNEAQGLGWRSGQTRTVTGYPLPPRAVRWGQPSAATSYSAPARASVPAQTQVRGYNVVRPAPSLPAQAPAIVDGNAVPNIARGIATRIEKRNNNSNQKSQTSPQSLLADYKEAKDESKKEDILDELKKLLEKEFATHQGQIQKQMDGIETQISDLEENVQMRKDAKDKIVELKLQTLINQANGLGF